MCGGRKGNSETFEIFSNSLDNELHENLSRLKNKNYILYYISRTTFFTFENEMGVGLWGSAIPSDEGLH